MENVFTFTSHMSLVAIPAIYHYSTKHPQTLGSKQIGPCSNKVRENLCGLTWPAAGIRQTLEERNVAPGVAQHRQRAGALPLGKWSWQRVARKSDKWNRILPTALAGERESASDNGNPEVRTPVPSTGASRRNDQAG